MNDYLTTQQLLDELQRRLDYDANVSEELATESNELQERIDKAIEYIEKTKCNDLNEGKVSKNTVYINELLHILKGDDE